MNKAFLLSLPFESYINLTGCLFSLIIYIASQPFWSMASGRSLYIFNVLFHLWVQFMHNILLCPAKFLLYQCSLVGISPLLVVNIADCLPWLFRDYTNPMLPVNHTAIEGAQQVLCYFIFQYLPLFWFLILCSNNLWFSACYRSWWEEERTGE